MYKMFKNIECIHRTYNMHEKPAVFLGEKLFYNSSVRPKSVNNTFLKINCLNVMNYRPYMPKTIYFTQINLMTRTSKLFSFWFEFENMWESEGGRGEKSYIFLGYYLHFSTPFGRTNLIFSFSMLSVCHLWWTKTSLLFIKIRYRCL